MRRNEKKAATKAGGSRLVRTKGMGASEANDRACLKDAILAVLPADKREDANLKMSAAVQATPADRDACPLDVKDALGELGCALERASGDYRKKGAPPSLLVLQDRESKLVLHIRLVDAANPDDAIQHFIAWDGEMIVDHPHSVRVNNGTDRTCPKKSQEAFGKLFKEFQSWQITAIFRLTAKK